MLKELKAIPNTIIYLLESSFSDKQILSAQKLLQLSQITISFKKGSPQQYFIVSGIVKEDRTFETRLTYKKDLMESTHGPIKSLCNCQFWDNLHHCHHVAALFIKYYIQNQHPHSIETEREESLPATNASNFHPHMGVHVQEYGTIVEGPHKFLGAQSSTSYSHHQYLLANRHSIINFPLPQEFTGSLKLNITSEILNDVAEAPTPIHRLLKILFLYIDSTEIEHAKISLFENLYLFDWEKGHALHLPAEIKDFIRKIKSKRLNLTIDDYLRITQRIRKENFFILNYQNTAVEKLPTNQIHYKIFIEPDRKKNYFHFKIGFFDQHEKSVPPPQIFSLFAFENGLLSSFRKKTDAFEFLKGIFESLNEDIPRNWPVLRQSQRRETMEEYTQFFLSSQIQEIFNAQNASICLYETYIIKKLYQSLYECFGPFFFRFSKYQSQEKMFVYEISNSSLLQNISKFHSSVSIFGVSLFYNSAPVTTWFSNIQVSRGQNPLDWFNLSVDIPKKDLELLRHLDPSENFSLSATGLILLTPAQKKLVKFLKRYGNFKENSKEDPDNTEGKKQIIPFSRARIFELFELYKLGIEGVLLPEEISLCQKLTTLKMLPSYDLPEIIGTEPRAYQVIGHNWLRFLFENKLGACLADDMGLGKTLQTIMFLKSVIDQVSNVLIVCPVSIIINWMNEIQKFTDLPVSIYYGGDRIFPQDSKIILTSYGVMKKEAETAFKDINFDILVLDEVQHLKNIKSLGAIAARKIMANFRICLTGTPVENHLTEFYNILDLSMPGIWGNLQLLRNLSQEDSLFWAKKTARPFILRRTKAQVLTDLPEKINNLVLLNFSDEERRNYLESLLKMRGKIQNTTLQKRYGEILKGLLELRQLCLWQKSEQVISTKIKFLLENLQQILEEGHQAIIFSQFTTYLDIIQKKMEEKTWKFSRIDGGQSIQKRQKQVDLFQQGHNRLFLISLKAGGVGLNLTAASYVFLMDPWWNPAVESQAIDRAHRIGQKNKLTVYRPVIKDSVEEKVLSLQKIKRELFDDLLHDQEEQFFTGKLTMEDFEGLFY